MLGIWGRLGQMAVTLAATGCLAAPIKLTTEHLPPFNIVAEDGKSVRGLAADKVVEMLRRAGIEYQLLPSGWNRAFALAKSQSDTCVFSTARLPEREALFNWVALLAASDSQIYVRADFETSAKSLDDLGAAQISVYRTDALAELLARAGKQLLPSESHEASLISLLAKRTDYWAAGNRTSVALLKKQAAQHKVRPLFNLVHIDLYLACNPGMDKALIGRLQQAYRQMEADGMLQKIEERYAP